jgi:DNA-binding HxlR family transcriptional regulator
MTSSAISSSASFLGETGIHSVGGPMDATGRGEVERSFREYRDSAAPLVERLSGTSRGDGDALGGVDGWETDMIRSIFGKWSPGLLTSLERSQSIGFEELRRTMPGLSARTLSLKLRALEEHDIVQRVVMDARPPRVRYALTDHGRTIAWLARPMLLYLRRTRSRSSHRG